MNAEKIENMLYDHAIRTKIRAPLSDRITNLGYNRVVSAGVVAGAALVCSLAMSNSSSAPAESQAFGSSNFRPQLSGTNPGQVPVYSATSHYGT